MIPYNSITYYILRQDYALPKSRQDSSEERRRKWKAFVHTLAPDVNPQAIQLMDEIRLVSHALYQTGELSVVATGLSYAKMRLLIGLVFAEELEGREHGLNPSEISERQGTGRNTISNLIRALETEGQIKRSLDQDDRRRFNIKLTEAGRELIYTHVSSHLRVVAGCFEALDKDEQLELSRLLSKLGQGVHASKEAVSRSA